MSEKLIDLDKYQLYMDTLCVPEDAILIDALQRMERENLPLIQVASSQGKFLQMLVQISGAKRVLEIGTLGGYSAIWLAGALPEDGYFLSLELDEHHAHIARQNLAQAMLNVKTEVRVGPAGDSLRELINSDVDIFDFIFIDADKDGYSDYLELALPLLRSGGLLIADNTLPTSAIEANGSTGTVKYNSAVAEKTTLKSVIVPTLKNGLDGMTISIKL